MKPEPEQIQFIKKSFQTLKSKEDLLGLLNYSKIILFGEKTIPFQLKVLTYYSNPKIASNRYVSFTVKKKSGLDRQIHAPVKGLKAIQRSLNLIFQVVFTPHPAATGFTNGKSIVSNASQHSKSNYVYNIDLKDFFPSIDQARVWKCLQLRPFNLSKENGRLELANIIASLCCSSMEVERLNTEGQWEKAIKNVLPQGAPTSPLITNIVCQKLDFLLSAVARRFGLRYSRYADDLTFSSLHNVYQKDSDFIKELNRIIVQQGFHVNQAKTRLQKEGFRQEVTGLIINDKVNAQSHYIKQLRAWLYFWETYGYDKAYKYFLNDYVCDKGHVKKGLPNMTNVIAGKLEYLKMVKGEGNQLYMKLTRRFDELAGNKTFVFQNVDITKNSIFSHNPPDTVKFLKSFKYDNENSFKDLVHRPIDETKFDYLNLLKTANKQFIELSQSGVNKIKLPKHLMTEVQSLFKKLSTIGLEFNIKTGLHPLEDKFVGSTIQEFKQNYRFGNERSESSILSNLISNIIEKRKHIDHTIGTVYSFGNEDTSGIFKRDQIVFHPDLQRFQSRANFFTWVPNIRLGLVLIFDSILKHSNVNGTRRFDTLEKKIIIDINRSYEGEIIKVELSILDQKSVFLGDLNNIMNDLRRDFFQLFIGVCDFKVQLKTPNEEYFECKILPYSDRATQISEIINGYKYTLTFYD